MSNSSFSRHLAACGDLRLRCLLFAIGCSFATLGCTFDASGTAPDTEASSESSSSSTASDPTGDGSTSTTTEEDSAGTSSTTASEAETTESAGSEEVSEDATTLALESSGDASEASGTTAPSESEGSESTTGEDSGPVGTPTPGLRYRYYEGANWENLPDFDSLTPAGEGTIHNFVAEVPEAGADFDNYGLVFEGWLLVPEAGQYEFVLQSDDGSRVIVDGTLIDNDGRHAASEEYEVRQTLALDEGYAEIRLEYFEADQSHTIWLRWDGPAFDLQDVPDDVLFYFVEGE